MVTTAFSLKAILDPDECQFQRYYKGWRQPRDNGVPESMWGRYYPGDEPGYKCRMSGDECSEEMDAEFCWRLTKSKRLCSECASWGGRIPMFYDSVDGKFICPACGCVVDVSARERRARAQD